MYHVVVCQHAFYKLRYMHTYTIHTEGMWIRLRWKCQWLLLISFFSGTYRNRNQRPGRSSGCPCERLLSGSVPLSWASPTRPWPMVIPPDVQVPQVLLLQELCIHPLPLLVCLLLWFLSPGERIDGDDHHPILISLSDLWLLTNFVSFRSSLTFIV